VTDSKERTVRPSDLFRYGLWAAVAVTARRNRREYGVPTAWLTHLLGNTATLWLPDLMRWLDADRAPDEIRPLVRAIQRRAADPSYAGYVAPLALGFVLSHPDYSIYHGRWAERTLLGFGPDSVPHAAAAYALARLTSETITTLDQELPATHTLAPITAAAARNVDAIAAGAVLIVTLIWEVGEYVAHHAEVERTGRDPGEVNMQWSLPDAITDSFANLAGLLAAIAVRRRAIARD
jgi:hypothetical protein